MSHECVNPDPALAPAPFPGVHSFAASSSPLQYLSCTARSFAPFISGGLAEKASRRADMVASTFSAAYQLNLLYIEPDEDQGRQIA